MSDIVDRRGASRESDVINRRKFLERNRPHVKRAIDKALSRGNVTDIGKGGVSVPIPKEDISEPGIQHDQGGISERVFPGNEEFQQGDAIPKPPGGGGGGQGNGSGDGDASEDGVGEDEFVANLSEEEFYDYLFKDLELPNLVKRSNQGAKRTVEQTAGYRSEGLRSDLSFEQSVFEKKKREVARGIPRVKKQILEYLEQEKAILEAYDSEGTHAQKPKAGRKDNTRKQIRRAHAEIDALKPKVEHLLTGDDAAKIAEIEEKVKSLEQESKLGWNERHDLMYHASKEEPVPESKAVMFCMMDVSGSMDQETKDRAKLFYLLLHRFLQRNYEDVDIVFIRHHAQAEEVDEQDFFYKQETGGTKASTALDKAREIIEERYSVNEWNIFGAHASDGDNWGDDNKRFQALLREMLPDFQGYFYTEISSQMGGFANAGRASNLWQAYEQVQGEFPDRLFKGMVKSRQDIWPVFKGFFEKQEAYSNVRGARPSALRMG